MEDESRSSPAMDALSPYFKTQRPPGPSSHDQGDDIAPLLVQRQKSSAIDATGFSFAKPAARQGGFSLRSLPKQCLINPGLSRNVRASEPQKETGGTDEVPLVAKAK